MSNALAVEARFTVLAFLKGWAQTGQLTYKFSVHENALEPARVRATFSKPTPAAPAPEAVAHLYFRLDPSLREVLGFTVESETHFHDVQALRFDEALLDHVVRRKRLLRGQQLVRLSDEFSSTRVPALVAERAREQRGLDREALEEYLLERFQRKDPYNDGRLAFHECRDVLFALELPALSRRDREILFAFVELDRDDMVDYGALVAIGAEVLDTLLHAQTQTSEAKGASDELEDAVECFQTLARHRQFFTMDRLAHALEAFRPAAPVAPATSEDAEGGEASSDPAPDESETVQEDANSEDAGANETQTTTTSRVATPLPPAEILVSRRQLRTSLEAPALLLSRAEINLMTALATATPAGLVSCAQLGELLQHVQATVFRFQTKCFADRVDAYVLQQFTGYETSKLEGSAEHLKMRIRQKEVKAVVKDMRKLLLSPLQASRVVALCEASATDPDGVVHYKECVPRIRDWLARQVDPHELRELASAAHAAHREPVEPADQLPDEDTVNHHAAEAFEALDDKQLGVLSIADFHASLVRLARALETTVLDDPDDVAAVTALADPLGQGRVNHVFFRQLVFPVLHWLQYETRVRTLRRDGLSGRAEAKALDDDDEAHGSKGSAK